MRTFSEIYESAEPQFDSYWAKSLVSMAMTQIKSKVLNSPKSKFQLMPPRNRKNEMEWANSELDNIKFKWKNHRNNGIDKVEELFWAAFQKEITDNRHLG